ncbi:DExH-box ATP-dependent RNA helicase DExH1-like [Homarus americanus]|uniref:DExH-box ATP-dependent RNA helicase DExH1-like n=1 Tax=Homarus americanus TaxID=6706 RepID=A0A8J5N9F6_HOMAM|nr:DExH-box ATP-dependent RNA helicase DExH1-like [Homarus americanus]
MKLSLGNSMGLEVDDDDVEELVEEHSKELSTEELLELHKEENETLKRSLTSEESGEEEDKEESRIIPAKDLKDAFFCWSKLPKLSEDYHPDVGSVQKAISCGKTTQVAQFILEDAIADGHGSTCHIVCTQPRRISAISVAQRVADERGEKLGKSIGYQIRLEARGFNVSAQLAEALSTITEDGVTPFDQTFFPNRNKLKKGSLMRRENFAEFLKKVATYGANSFYALEFGVEEMEALRAKGSEIQVKDFDDYRLSSFSTAYADETDLQNRTELLLLSTSDEAIDSSVTPASPDVPLLPEQAASSISVIDTFDQYVTTVVGLGTYFGSRVMTKHGILFNNHLANMLPHPSTHPEDVPHSHARPLTSYTPVILTNTRQKLELIRKLEAGASVARVCDEFGVKKQTVSDTRKAKDKLTAFSLKYYVDATSKSSSVGARKLMRVAKDTNLEESVTKWFVQQRSCGNVVRGVEIQAAAVKLASHMGIENFEASDGWLWRFRNHHGMCHLPKVNEINIL